VEMMRLSYMEIKIGLKFRLPIYDAVWFDRLASTRVFKEPAVSIFRLESLIPEDWGSRFSETLLPMYRVW